jgi:nucleoredoxin
LNQGSVVRFDDEGLERKKYFLFFFSANASPNGRKFTPKLVDYYSRVEPQHPEFDVIFFSADRSQFGMETYLREANMPWAAVDYQQIGAKAAGMDPKIVQEIPCLVLIDRAGRVLSQTKSGENGKTPDEVLADVDQVLSGANAKQIARSH